MQTRKQGNIAMRCKSHIFILIPRNSHSIFNSSCIDIGQCTLIVWTLTPGGVLQSQISWKSENPTFEEILSLPTSNLTDAPARSRVIESDIVSFTLWLCWLLNFTEERPIRTQALGYYRESIELSWLPGLYYRVWTPPPRVQVSRWQHVVDKGCNNMEIETQESYHPRRHQNNFAQ